MTDLFAFKTHFDYLRHKLNPRNSQRGIKAKVAEFLRIQPAFLSQVLAEKFSLSLEQADLANQFFDHSKEEAEFFLLLVSCDRAGTESLKKHFESQIQLLLKKRLLVVERLGRKSEISDETKGVYYASWLYAATHVACTISALQTRQAIAKHFHIPVELAGKILDFLMEQNLLTKNAEKYSTTQSWIRLDKESPHIIKHHTNWRQKAIQNLELQTNEDLHYSGVFSMDRKTALKIQDQFLNFIQQQLKMIESAKEEELYVFNGDFFSLLKK